MGDTQLNRVGESASPAQQGAQSNPSSENNAKKKYTPPRKMQGPTIVFDHIDNDNPDVQNTSSSTKRRIRRKRPGVSGKELQDKRKDSSSRGPNKGSGGSEMFVLWTDQWRAGANPAFSQEDWEKKIANTGQFDNKFKFGAFFRKSKWSTQPPRNVYRNVRLFREGIKPLWEDEANVHGGKWVFEIDKEHSISAFEALVKAILPEGELKTMDTAMFVNGVVLAVRREKDLLSVWNKDAEDREVIDAVGADARDVVRKVASCKLKQKYQRHDWNIRRLDRQREKRKDPSERNRTLSAATDATDATDVSCLTITEVMDTRTDMTDMTEGDISDDDVFGSEPNSLTNSPATSPEKPKGEMVAQLHKLELASSPP